MTIPLLPASSPLWTAASFQLNYSCLRLPYRTDLISQSQSHFTSGGLPSISSSWRQALWDSRLVIFSNWTLGGHSRYVTDSLTRGWVCHLQLLLVLVSGVILRSESHGTHDHILPSHIRDFLNLEGEVPVFISPTKRVARLYPQALGFFADLFATIVFFNPSARTEYTTSFPIVPPFLHAYPLQRESVCRAVA
jgi:hypothetical protein